MLQPQGNKTTHRFLPTKVAHTHKQKTGNTQGSRQQGKMETPTALLAGT